MSDEHLDNAIVFLRRKYAAMYGTAPLPWPALNRITALTNEQTRRRPPPKTPGRRRIRLED